MRAGDGLLLASRRDRGPQRLRLADVRGAAQAVTRSVSLSSLPPAEPTPIRMTIPMPENISNPKQSGWRGRAARKEKYFKRLDELQGAGLLPPPPPRAFPKATIRATMYVGAAMDEANAIHRAEKWPCDWLKTRGYIVDDRRSCLRWEAMPEQIVRRDGNYRIDITLTPVVAPFPRS